MENFYVIYGEDKELVKYKANELIEKLKIDDVVRYDMSSTLIEDVILDASMPCMFSGQKLIILDDCSFLTGVKSSFKMDSLEEYIIHYNPDNCLIFLVYSDSLDGRKKINKLLSKHEVIEVKKKDTVDLKEYVINYFNKDCYKIEDVNYFLEVVGSNIFNIMNECDKLKMYSLDDKIIHNEDIDRVCVSSFEEEIFSLVDAIVERDKLKSFRLLEGFLHKNYDEMQIIMILASQFRFFFQVKRLLSQNKSEGDIAKILGVNPYRVKFTVRKLYSFSESMIISCIKGIAKMDYDVKLGFMDKRVALEMFLLEKV